MDKKHQFIIEVQTGLIIRHILQNVGNGRKAMYSALIALDDAFYAADRIPDDVSAHEAACHWLEHRFGDNKEPGYHAPSWLMCS
jgi:hypothetical protein